MDLEDIRRYALKNGLKFSENHLCQSVKKFETLTSSQISTHAIARMYATSDPRVKSKRGALIFHETGSGKTCCATCIIDAFWDTDMRIFVVSSPSALKSNPSSSYEACCAMLPRFSGKDVSKEFSKRKVEFVTFAVLAHSSGVYRPSMRARNFGTSPCVYIIDEAHTIFRPIPTQKKEMNAFLQVLLTRNPKDRMFFLTATPGETCTDIIRMLNVLSAQPLTTPSRGDERTIKEFVHGIKYMVSRFDSSFDQNVYPKVSIEDVRVRMTVRQYERYREAVNGTDASDRDYNRLKKEQKLHRFYSSARRFSNALYKVSPGDSIAQVSCKLPAVAHGITSFPDQKHYVYSCFGDRRGDLGGQGIHAIASVLRDIGYQELSNPMQIISVTDENGIIPMLRIPRFVLVEGRTTDLELNHILTLFNDPRNRDGEYLQVLLATGNFFESIDLKSVRHVHLLEPMLSAFAEEQAIGRAARRCSHAQYEDVLDRTVSVHRYYALAPSEEDVRNHYSDEKQIQHMTGYVRRKTIDEHVDDVVRKRYEPVSFLLNLLQYSAADCAVYTSSCAPK